MRILVVSAFEASSQFAHAINTVKMAEGFAKLGHDVTIICRRPLTGNAGADHLESIYGLQVHLDWVQLPAKVMGYFVGEHWFFSLMAMPAVIWLRPELIFTRNYIFPWMSSKLGYKTVSESHAHPDNDTRPFRRFVKAMRHDALRLWVTISQYLADHYLSLDVPIEKLLVLPDAVDLDLFRRPPQLPPSPYLDSGPNNVAYVGHLYDYKGIPTIIATAKLLPDVCFHLVGGFPDDLARQKKRVAAMGLQNIRFYGLKPHKDVPNFLWHADVLLLPPSQHHPSAKWTSPLKLGEYLASGTPVVATAIPALKDWLTDDQVNFVEPDDAVALAKGILDIINDSTLSHRLQRNGLRKAQDLSYQKRAERILENCSLIDDKKIVKGAV